MTVTANQVTAVRMLLMPAISWLLYQGEGASWVALILGIAIGATDYLDGHLARKHGPTALGRLLDPVADKIFIALAYLPVTDLGALPALPVALMFTREFLITSLRSLYAQRGLEMTTSYFAKVKTWVQMQGGAYIMLVLLLHEQRKPLLVTVGVTAVVPAIIGAVLWVVQRRFRRGVWIMAGFSSLVFLMCLPRDYEVTVGLLMWLIVVVTWWSGLDYLAVGIPRLRAAAELVAADWVRVAGAIATPVLAVVVLLTTPVHPVPILALFAVELSVGVLDNLLSLHGSAPGLAVWGARTGAITAALVAALIVPELATLLVAIAVLVSVAGVVREARVALPYLRRADAA